MYSIDTSALISGWVEHYPPGNFPAVWERINDLGAAGRLIASRSVRDEIEEREDRLIDWCNGNSAVFQEDEEAIQQRVRRIFGDWPQEVDWTRFITGADPFVIAHAQHRDWTVVTSERQVRSLNAPRIPDVCVHYGVRWTSLLGMIQEQGWRF